MSDISASRKWNHTGGVQQSTLERSLPPPDGGMDGETHRQEVGRKLAPELDHRLVSKELRTKDEGEVWIR